MSGNCWFSSIHYGDEGDNTLVGGSAGHNRLDGRTGGDELDGGSSNGLLDRRRACPGKDGARLSRLLHVFVPSASRGWRKAVRALAAALLLLLGAGGVAAQGTLPTVSVSDAEAYEDGRFVHFEVSLSQASSEQVTAEFATSSGTARSGTDFRGLSQTVTFPANSGDPQSVLVSLRNDQTPEPDETFTVTLTNPVGATLGDATATGTIRNDDSAATLAASGIGETTATLTIAGHTGGWWYKGGEYSIGPLGYNWQAALILRRNVHSCTAVAAGTAAVSIGGLTAARSHDYRAYSDSTCSTRLARVKFQTLAPEGTPTVSVSDAEVSEDGDWMDFTVSLSQGSRERVMVRAHTSSGTATSGADFRHVSRTLTFSANSGTPQSVRVFVHDDEEPEPDETFTVTLTNPLGATLGDATATGTIRDDGDTAATLTASDIEDATATLTIAGHTDGWWYQGDAHACTAVVAGTTAVSISGLTTVTDYEYTAYSDSACGTRLARTKFTTLAPEGTPTVSISDAEVSEGGDVTFAVSLSHPSRERVSVEVHTSSGTATSWYDFVARPQTLTFRANSSRITRYARVEALDDEEPEPDETFTATLRVPVGATLGDAMATGTIKDDGDTAATLTASDIEDTTATLTIGGHTDAWWYGGGNADLCTAVAAGTTAVSISGLTTVTDYEYTAYSDSACSTKLARVEFHTLAPEGKPTVSISDAEAYEDGGSMRFEVSLSHPSRTQVFVRTDTSNGTARGTHGDFAPGIDFRHEFPGMGVIFEANSPVTTKSMSVKVYDDQEPEPDETFTVTLTSKRPNVILGDATATGTIRDDGDTAARLTASDIEDTTATLTISGHTDAWWYKGEAHSCTAVAAGTTAVSIGGLTTISNYDYAAYSDSGCQTKLARVEFTTIAPEGTPTVSVSDAAASEDWGIRFEVSLSHPSREPVTVWYETSGGTATSGTDFTATSYNLKLPANSWNRGYAVGVHLLDDQEPEPDETFTLTLTKATGATLGDATATGTILDDGDTAATLTASDIEDTTATLTIGGHTDGWWYRGNAHSCTAVAAGTTAVSISGLTAVTNYKYRAYSGSGCTTKLAAVEFKTLAAEVTPTVSVSDAEVSEDGKRMFFLVSLSQPIRKQVTVDVRTSGGTATSGTDFEAVSQTLIIPANSSGRESVPVLVHDDQGPEPDETFTVTLTNPVNATLGDATATGTIRDDGDTAATLTPSDIEDTTATLTIGSHTDAWWYEGNAHACTAVTAGTAVVSISGLTTVTTYDYTAYSDSACSTKLARVEFRTLAPEGTPTVSVSDAEVSEDGSWMQFLVSLSQPSREEVTVDVRTSDGTATSGTDFKAVSQTLTFPANSRGRHSLPVLVHDDQEPEPDETFTLTLTNATGATLGDATATGTILDDGDTPATLTAGDIEDTTATLTISRHTDGWWFKGNTHACTAVAAGTTAVSISGLTTVTDYEYTAYGDSACSTILDKVEFRTLAPEGTPTVSIFDAEVSEDGGYVTFAVSLSQPSRDWVSVQFVPSDGTATGGTDFDARAGRMLFFPDSSEITRHVRVAVHDDQEAEPDETFTVTLTNPMGATLGDAAATGTIRDDDDTAATGVAVVSDPGGDVTYAAGDTVRVAVTFSEAVEVDTEDGTPRLKLDLGGDDGAGERWAAYDGGSGTETLTFAWTAAAPDETAAGVAVLADTLEPNGGTIRSAATQADVALGHPGRDHDPAHKVDAVAPSVASASVNGNALTVTFDEDLAAASLANGAFAVKKTPSGGTEAAVGLSTTTGPAISGKTVTLTLASAVMAGDTAIKVSYTMPTSGSANRLADAAGNEVGSFSGRAVTNATAPAATGVALTSDPGEDATYAAGDIVRVAVTFDEAVDVGTDGGTPRLKLELGGDDGAGERWAAYESGSGTETLTFAWTAAAPDVSAGGIAVLADKLELNGGTIASVATQSAAALGHAGLAHDAAHKVDAAPPELVRGEIDGGTMTLWFSEPLDPDWTGGRFEMGLQNPQGGVGFRATGEVTVEGNTVTVGMGAGRPRAQAGLKGNSVIYRRLADGSDGPLRDLAGNPVLTPRTPAGDGEAWRYVRIELVNVTGAAPRVTGVAVVSDAGDDDTYALGDTIRVQVTFSEPVDVTGSPRLKIDMDPAHWGEKWAAYTSGSGTSSLTFAHTVVEPNLSTQGIAVQANTLELDGGTIRAGGADADLAHDGLAHDANHKVDWRTEPESGPVGTGGPDGTTGDSGPPSVTAVSVVSSPASGSTYMLGETIRIRATFSEAVTVTGSPGLNIDMDPAHWGTKQAAYEGGSGTTSLTFAHTVVEPNYSTQGIAVLANTLALGGGAIRSAGGTNAALGHSGLNHDSNHKVDWRPTISVADARANEGAGVKVAFEVNLSRAFTTAAHSVTVDYATADSTAKAGEDYTETSGTLTFAAGERTKTVNVPVLDDAIDEGEETFVLRLSNVQGARAGDLEATGTIANDDPLQKMWLSRFGRTVAGHVTDAVSDRLAAPLAGVQVTLGEQRVDPARMEDEGWHGHAMTSVARAPAAPVWTPSGDGGWPGAGPGMRELPAASGSPARTLAGRELLLGSAFHLAHEDAAGGPGLAAWGRVTVGGFDSEALADAHGVRIDGEVTTGILGADAEWDRLLAGVAVSLSEGEGSFDQPGVDSGAIESTMTAVSPYARFAVSERLSVWGLAGWGTGNMTIAQAANGNQRERVTRTDLEMRLAALGGRGALLRADETGGFNLALRADAFHVETEAEAVSNEGGTTAVASQVRFALEGSRAFDMGGGTLTPGVELGLRHDGGDAETGTGVELGGRVSWTDPETGLSVEAGVRTLIAHEDSEHEEWGASGSLRLDPGDRGRGLSFSLAPTWGTETGGVDRLWSARDARALAPGTTFESGRRLEGELGYGLALPGGFTGTPNVGFGISATAREWRIGWRLTPAAGSASGFEANLDATRRETAVGAGEPQFGAGLPVEHELTLRGVLRW